jgi:hypothetical protein
MRHREGEVTSLAPPPAWHGKCLEFIERGFAVKWATIGDRVISNGLSG